MRPYTPQFIGYGDLKEKINPVVLELSFEPSLPCNRKLPPSYDNLIYTKLENTIITVRHKENFTTELESLYELYRDDFSVIL